MGAVVEGFEVVYGVGCRKTRKRFSRQNNALRFEEKEGH
jgi:hypothetical protein